MKTKDGTCKRDESALSTSAPFSSSVTLTLFERLPDVSGAMVSGEFNSQVLQEAEQEGYLVLRKPLEPARLHALLTQWGAS
ncbi:hypothetical protein [Serratia ureilytica]|uniref:hypothetical protein n=1 Tax=Serratia ureilytica TaxID=300181 RepID=UPI0018E731F3|nr:hypothetical protein [Serratia ureilytica]EMD1304622.1 hypothetical protein [Serratia marcescens]MBJ2100902.1 hypothetical protein [Serratia ureilytica]MBN5387727.1 hypothetical protein [Serratia ureilytica]